MEENEFEFIRTSEFVPSATATDETSYKTLLLGYTTERGTHHLYQMFGVLHLVVYNGSGIIEHLHGKELPLDKILPVKRFYPESCDYEFVLELKKRGEHLAFAPYDHERASRIRGRDLHGRSAVFGGAEDAPSFFR